MARARTAVAGRRLAGIEGLRAVAAGAIVVHHTWMLDGGERLGAGGKAGDVFLNLALGVTLFFALSGFLLYRPFAAAIARGRGRPGIRNYLRNRALRILPAYWVILAIVALVLGAASLRDESGRLATGALTDPLELLSAALLVHDYDPQTMVIGIGPAWSLAVEAVFYLVLPLLVLGAAAAARRAASRRGRVLALLAPPLLLLAVGLTGKAVAGLALPATPGAGYETDWHSVVERSFWAQADLFAFGMVAAVVHTEIADGRVALPRGWRPAALAIAAAIFVPCAITLDYGQLSYLPQNTAVALSAGLLLLAVTVPAADGRLALPARVLEARPLVWVGLVSYSVFLWHEPLIRWLAERGVTQPGWPGLAANLLIVAAVVGVLSAATYRWVERPALRLKRRRQEPAPAMPIAQMEAAP